MSKPGQVIDVSYPFYEPGTDDETFRETFIVNEIDEDWLWQTSWLNFHDPFVNILTGLIVDIGEDKLKEDKEFTEEVSKRFKQ